ncbi:MAG: hypothetical protein ACXWL2_04805 [Candidatus Chromulinivorax sp.]
MFASLFDRFINKQPEYSACLKQKCEHATRPRGAHCNYQGQFLQAYKPQLLTTDIHHVKDFMLSNPHGINLTKISTVFPQDWSPSEITLKVVQALSSENKKVIPLSRFGCLKIVAYTQENIELVIFYDIKKKSLALFYPNFQE